MKKKVFVLIVIFIPLMTVLVFLLRTDIKMKVLGYKVESLNCKLEDGEYFLDYKKSLKTGSNMNNGIYQVFLKTNKGNLYEVPFDSFGWIKNLNIQKFSSGENCRKIMAIAGYECSYLEKDYTKGILSTMKYCYFYDTKGSVLTTFGSGAMDYKSKFQYNIDEEQLIILGKNATLDGDEVTQIIIPRIETLFDIQQQLHTLSPFDNQAYMYISEREEIIVLLKKEKQVTRPDGMGLDLEIEYIERKLLDLKDFLFDEEKTLDLYVSEGTVFLTTNTSLYRLNNKMILNRAECENYADVECKKGYGLQKVNYAKNIDDPIYFISENKKTVIITRDKVYIKDYRN